MVRTAQVDSHRLPKSMRLGLPKALAMGYHAFMKLLEYIRVERGRAAQLARALGVRPVMIHQWATGQKPVPLARCMPIEAATSGVVARCDLRDDAQVHWPEACASVGAIAPPTPTTPEPSHAA